MHDIGRQRRWHRFLDAHGGKALIVPIDHGLTLGPIDGLQDVRAVRAWLESGALTGAIMHKGMVERLDGAPGIGLMVHLNGAVRFEEELPADPSTLPKPQLTTVSEAVHLGADAVSVHLDLSAQYAGRYLELLGKVVGQAHACGLPVLAMLYDKAGAETSLVRQRHLMRAAIEVGADVLKVQPPADLRLVPALLEGIVSHTAVLFAGGALADERELLALAQATLDAGGAGLCVGRNIFQRSNPAMCLARLRRVLNPGGAPRAPGDAGTRGRVAFEGAL